MRQRNRTHLFGNLFWIYSIEYCTKKRYSLYKLFLWINTHSELDTVWTCMDLTDQMSTSTPLSQMLTVELCSETIWMVLFLFILEDTMSMISTNSLKRGLVRPQLTLSLCISRPQTSSGPVKSFLDVVDIICWVLTFICRCRHELYLLTKVFWSVPESM